MPEIRAQRAFPSLVYFSLAEADGHSRAWDATQVFAREVRAAFRAFR